MTGDNGQVSTTRTSKRTDCRSLPTLAGHKTHRHGLAAARGGPLRERRLDHGAPVYGPPPAYRKEKPRHARSDVSHLSGSPGPPWAEPPSPASSPTPATRTRSTAPGWQRPQDLCTCPSRCLEHFPHILTWPAPSGRSVHPASPVLLTKNGPLSVTIKQFFYILLKCNLKFKTH